MRKNLGVLSIGIGNRSQTNGKSKLTLNSTNDEIRQTYPQSGAGHQRASGSMAKIRRIENSSYFHIKSGSPHNSFMSVKKTKINIIKHYWIETSTLTLYSKAVTVKLFIPVQLQTSLLYPHIPHSYRLQTTDWA